MLGPLLGGWLLQVAGFSTAFVTAGTLGVVAVLLFLLMKLPPQIPRVSSGTRTAAVHHEMTRGARTAFGNVRVVMTSATDGTRQEANGTLSAFLPNCSVRFGHGAAQ